MGALTKKIILVRRYDKKIDQEFMDLEFARLDYENEMQNEWIKEELTGAILFYQINQNFPRLDSRIQRRNSSKGEQKIGNL